MSQDSKLFAILIGVNYYLANRLPNGGRYGHLQGCVRDVEQMESFLKTQLAVSDSNIIRLTASDGGTDVPAEEPALWPTYENIVASFHQMLEMTQPGDQVVIHYSGHGGRANSVYPADIKPGGIDEGLVPTDIGDGSRYLRDLELAYLLHRMTEKGLLVTVLLDCCHSGGMTRGNGVARGIDELDTAKRPSETLAASSVDTLLETWRQLTSGTRAATAITAGGLPASNDWVVLAACRPQEVAYEYSFDGRHRSGALSYWLMNALESGVAGLSYKHLHQRLLARIQAQFSTQRPQLYGDGMRAVFGRNRIEAQFAAPVLKVNEARGEVVLNAGSVQGVRRGAQFAIFPLEAADLKDFESAAATVTVIEESATESKAAVDEGQDWATIEPGAQAVLFNPASVRLRSYVRLQTDGEGILSIEAQEALRDAHETSQSGNFVEWADGDQAADFIVAVENGFYEIWDTAGEVIPRINPSLALNDDAAAERVIERLIHLSRYRNVQQLANTDSRVGDVLQVTFEWIDVPADHVFSEGDEAKLLVRNDSEKDVEITVLDLATDWSISQVYPNSSAESYTFAPGESDELVFEVFVSGDEDTEASTYKLFATLNGSNFRMLELPSLDRPFTRAVMRSVADLNDLEALLHQAVETIPPTRAGRLRSPASREWKTAEVELRVKSN